MESILSNESEQVPFAVVTNFIDLFFFSWEWDSVARFYAGHSCSFAGEKPNAKSFYFVLLSSGSSSVVIQSSYTRLLLEPKFVEASVPVTHCSTSFRCRREWLS